MLWVVLLVLPGRQMGATSFLRYAIWVSSGPPEVWRVSFAGGKPQKLLEMDGLSDISVHPDGRRMAFTGGQIQMAEIWAMENFLILG